MENNEWNEVKSDSGFWDPEKEGEELIGELIEVVQGQFGNQYVILKEDETKIKTPSHKVLQSRLQACKVGDTVKIVFMGEDLPKVKGQNPTKLYSVFVKGPVKEEQVQ